MKNITLIGMPGCGKSTAGVVLAKQLSYDFLDTDLSIQKSENQSLQSILDKHGYLVLREIEEREILKIGVEQTVIATGGSAVYSEKSMSHLKSISTIVFIDVSLAEIKRRVTNFESRGIASSKNQTLEELFEERSLLYRKYADEIIESNALNIEETVRLIQSRLIL